METDEQTKVKVRKKRPVRRLLRQFTVTVFDKEYQVEALTYLRARHEGARRYNQENPDGKFPVIFLRSIARARLVELPTREKYVGSVSKTHAGLNRSSFWIKGTRVQTWLRPRPTSCELCSREGVRLFHHHWNDDKPELGVFVCWECHKVCELVDELTLENISKKYLELKEDTEEQRSRIKDEDFEARGWTGKGRRWMHKWTREDMEKGNGRSI
jgi:hypothetical protein